MPQVSKFLRLVVSEVKETAQKMARPSSIFGMPNLVPQPLVSVTPVQPQRPESPSSVYSNTYNDDLPSYYSTSVIPQQSVSSTHNGPRSHRQSLGPTPTIVPVPYSPPASVLADVQSLPKVSDVHRRLPSEHLSAAKDELRLHRLSQLPTSLSRITEPHPDIATYEKLWPPPPVPIEPLVEPLVEPPAEPSVPLIRYNDDDVRFSNPRTPPQPGPEYATYYASIRELGEPNKATEENLWYRYPLRPEKPSEHSAAIRNLPPPPRDPMASTDYSLSYYRPDISGRDLPRKVEHACGKILIDQVERLLEDVTHKELVEHLAAVVVADFEKGKSRGGSNAGEIVDRWMVKGHGKAINLISFDSGEWF